MKGKADNSLPTITVVLNVYNEAKNIVDCLSRIREQNYPQNKIKIIIVDDDSTDNTVALAKQFKVEVVKSGYRNRERAKGIGIKHATGDLLLLMDCDVFLFSKNWLKKAVEYLSGNPNAVGVQNIRWSYKKNDNIANRYCNLFGINDPMAEYLGKRGVLMNTETKWPYASTIVEEKSNYLVAKFTINNLPTIGAQGYLVRRKFIQRGTWYPYFFHMDNAYELVEKGYSEFILAKLPIGHAYVNSVPQFYRKLYRNIRLYLQLSSLRRYRYQVSKMRFITALFLMLTIIHPFVRSLKGYLKKPDIAWFLHPLFAFTIPVMYAWVVVAHGIKTGISKTYDFCAITMMSRAKDDLMAKSLSKRS